MHPNPTFGWTDQAEMRAFITAHSFAHIFAATPDGPMVAHAPVIVTALGDIHFHLARGNRLAKHLAGSEALISITGVQAYLSPDWYATTDQVPTWLYGAAEAEGRS